MLTGLLVFLLGAAALTLLYGVNKSSPGVITMSLWLTAFALLCQVVRRRTLMRSVVSPSAPANAPVETSAKVSEPKPAPPIVESPPVMEAAPAPLAESVLEVGVVEPPSALIPFGGYDELSPASIMKVLSSMAPSELDNAHRYESENAGRSKVLKRIEQLQRKSALSDE